MYYDNAYNKNQPMDANRMLDNVIFQNIHSMINGNNLMNMNDSMLMENHSGVRTSVKVHGPPGGYSSIKFG